MTNNKGLLEFKFYQLSLQNLWKRVNEINEQEDIELMDAIKVNSYRFSISWARILPSMLLYSA